MRAFKNVVFPVPISPMNNIFNLFNLINSVNVSITDELILNCSNNCG